MQLSNSNVFSVLLDAYNKYDKQTMDVCLKWLSKELLDNNLQLTKEQNDLKQKIPNELNEMILDALIQADLKRNIRKFVDQNCIP